ARGVVADRSLAGGCRGAPLAARRPGRLRVRARHTRRRRRPRGDGGELAGGVAGPGGRGLPGIHERARGPGARPPPRPARFGRADHRPEVRLEQRAAAGGGDPAVGRPSLSRDGPRRDARSIPRRQLLLLGFRPAPLCPGAAGSRHVLAVRADPPASPALPGGRVACRDQIRPARARDAGAREAPGQLREALARELAQARAVLGVGSWGASGARVSGYRRSGISPIQVRYSKTTAPVSVPATYKSTTVR